MTIQVEIKMSYGKRLIYPKCNKAQLFADMLKQTVLTDDNIKVIKELGYTIEVIQDKVEL